MDLARVAQFTALRRDWQPSTRQTLLHVAAILRAEAMAQILIEQVARACARSGGES
jgi:hypothetical protein